MKKNFNVCMYRMLTLLAFVVITEYCIAGNNDRRKVYYQKMCKEDYGLKGPVCSVVEKDCEFAVKFGEIVRTGAKNTHIYFYANGNVYKEVYSSSAYKKFQYDKLGYIISVMTIKPESGEKIRFNNEYIFDNDTTDYYKYENKYNTDGTIKEIKKYKVVYNQLSQTDRVVITNSSGIKKVVFYADYGYDFEKEDTYINNKRISKKSTPTNVYDWTNYTTLFNKDGLVTQETVSYIMRNGSLFAEELHIYNYDANKNIIKETISASRNSRVPFKPITTTIEYIYDDHGNWTRKMEYRGNRLVSWRERDIYYATEERDYNNIIEEDVIKDEKRIARLNDIRHKIESAAQAKKALEEAEMAEGKIFDVALEMPSFIGGPVNMTNWISRNVRYPKEAKDRMEQGDVVVTFVVEKDGTTSNVKIKKGVSRALDDEALRLVKSMNGWIPARNDGEIVRCRYSVRVPFRLK